MTQRWSLVGETLQQARGGFVPNSSIVILLRDDPLQLQQALDCIQTRYRQFILDADENASSAFIFCCIFPGIGSSSKLDMPERYKRRWITRRYKQ